MIISASTYSQELEISGHVRDKDNNSIAAAAAAAAAVFSAVD